MAVPSATNWDVRTTGNNNNGGGFVIGASGTDYSTQDSPQYALTLITSSGAGNTVLSASAAAAMVGNIAQVISGTNFNTGFFEVVSVSVGVSITFGTNSASQSICSGVGASGVINIGGGLLTITAAQTPSTALNTIWIKSGTYSLSTGLTIPNANMLYEGYGTSHGDQGTSPVITTSASISLVADVASGANNIIFNNIVFQSTAGSPGNGFEATSRAWAGLTLVNCKLTGFASGIWGDNAAPNVISDIQAINCEFTGMSFNGIEAGDGVYCYGCYFHGNTRNGILSGTLPTTNSSIVTIRCIFASNSESGIEMDFPSSGASLYAFNCSFYNNTQHGIVTANTLFTSTSGIVGNIFYDNGEYGFSSAGTTGSGPGLNQNNAYGANGSGPRNNISAGLNDISLSGNPFTNPSSGDFSLNNNSSAGAACRVAGFPGILRAGGTGYQDIGALQHQDSAGSTNVPVNNLITQYIDVGREW